MQSQHGVVLGLSEAIAVLEMEFVRGRVNALALGDTRVAMLVDDEHVQQRGCGDIRLVADFGEAGLDCRIADADGGPVIEELAGSGVLCDGFQSGSGVVVNGLVLELADGTTIQQGFDSCIGSHDCIVARLACIGDVGCLTVKYA